MTELLKGALVESGKSAVPGTVAVPTGSSVLNVPTLLLSVVWTGPIEGKSVISPSEVIVSEGSKDVVTPPGVDIPVGTDMKELSTEYTAMVDKGI